MITIRNLSNQPHLVDDKSLGVDSEVKVKAVTDDIRRLVEKGFVAIVEPASTDAKAKAEAEAKAKAEAENTGQNAGGKKN